MGVDDFYKVVHANWGHLLPNLQNAPPVQIVIVDQVEETARRRIKHKIPDVIQIDDEDDDEDEAREFLDLKVEVKTEEDIAVRMNYLQQLDQCSMLFEGFLQSRRAYVVQALVICVGHYHIYIYICIYTCAWYR